MKIPKPEKKESVVLFRCSKAELSRIEQLAKKYGHSNVSAWVRYAAQCDIYALVKGPEELRMLHKPV